MNEKLKVAVDIWNDMPESDQLQADYATDGLTTGHCVLAAAARGEIPGFQLVPYPPTEEMLRPSDDWCDTATNKVIYCAMIEKFKEQNK